ncbi:MAG: hypothetical protein GX345_01425 [Clostridiales bacterium]|nr:hypothetical protein [Clostridiales bacterium]
MSLLKKQLTVAWLTGFIWVSNLFLFFFIALLLGKVLRKISGEYKIPLYFALTLFFFTDYSTKVFAKNLGLHDVYMVIIVLLCILTSRQKWSTWLVIPLCLAGTAIHYGFLFQFFPLIFIIILFGALKTNERLSHSLVAVISPIATILSSLYFILIAPYNPKTNIEKSLDYLEDKVVDFEFWRLFAGGIYFNYNGLEDKPLESFGDLFYYLRLHTTETFSWIEFITLLAFLTPLFMLFWVLWKEALKNSENKAQKLVFILCFLMPIPLIPWFFWTTDHPRFLSEIILCQFCVLFYLIYNKNKALEKSLKSMEEKFKRYPALLIPSLILPLASFYFK